MLTCKRGLAAHLAAYIANGARTDDATVCVVDADIESRDLGARFGVFGPLLLDVAKNVAVGNGRTRLDEMIARVDPPGIWVLPTRPPQSALLPMLRTKTSSLLGPLRAGFDYLVVDAPVGLGVDAPESDRAILHHVDALVVAVTADPSAIGGALRYLNTLAVARNRNALPSSFSIHLALTGSDHDGTRTLYDEAQLDRKLHGLSVVATIPQLWGRQRPDGPLDLQDDRQLQQAFNAIMRTVTAAERARSSV
jgi:MinD-like ATPase involved in chromosome partitioning or flagellar assembly